MRAAMRCKAKTKMTSSGRTSDSANMTFFAALPKSPHVSDHAALKLFWHSLRRIRRKRLRPNSMIVNE